MDEELIEYIDEEKTLEEIALEDSDSEPEPEVEPTYTYLPRLKQMRALGTIGELLVEDGAMESMVDKAISEIEDGLSYSEDGSYDKYRVYNSLVTFINCLENLNGMARVSDQEFMRNHENLIQATEMYAGDLHRMIDIMKKLVTDLILARNEYIMGR